MPSVPAISSPAAPDLVTHYLKNVRGAVPLGIEQIDTILQLIGSARDRIDSFLDLGCGDGVLSAAILGEHPHSHAVVMELVPGPTSTARANLKDFAGRVTYIPADIAYPGWVQELRGEPQFDAVVCGFALQPLSDRRKQSLFGELFRLLQPDGIFLNIEHVASATRWSESKWDDTMITAFFGQFIKEHPEKSRAEIAREYYEQARTDASRCAPFEVQLDWLRAAGFTNVDCYLKIQELALFGGQRPSESGNG